MLIGKLGAKLLENYQPIKKFHFEHSKKSYSSQISS